MEHRITIAGFGGQGVLLIGQVLCYAGLAEGKNVSWLPSYGPEMRGGTASCSVIISDSEIASPLVTKSDYCLVLNLPSLIKYQDRVKPGGEIYINSSLIDQKCERSDIKKVYVPANDAAHQAGNLKAVNMAMLGAFVGKTGILPQQSVLDALKKIFGERRAHLLPVNEKVMQLGQEMAKEEQDA